MMEPYTPPLKMAPDITLADYSGASTHWGSSVSIGGHVVSPAESVTVPYGTFSAIHVKNVVNVDGTPHDEDFWWIKGVGIVNEVYSAGASQETSGLTNSTAAP
jgi:hypothetical protein